MILELFFVFFFVLLWDDFGTRLGPFRVLDRCLDHVSIIFGSIMDYFWIVVRPIERLILEM